MLNLYTSAILMTQIVKAK